jgi:hypothetical protein
MIEILPKDFHDALFRLDHAIKFSSAQGMREATSAETIAVLETIDGLRYHCLKLGLKETEDHCDKLNNWLKDPSYHRFPPGDAIPASSFQYIYRALAGIAAKLSKELDMIRFAGIPANLVQLFEQDALFGEQVNKAFRSDAPGIRSAATDIRDAGNCLAADLNTAAVFHLMCAVEQGLRKLADDLQVVAVKQTVPIELATWNEIITELQKKVDERVSRSDSEGQRTLDSYSALLLEFRAIETFWRNKVMHVRATYTAGEAEMAKNHVERFMKRLADREALE